MTTGKKIALGLLAIIGLGGGGFLLYKKFGKKEDAEGQTDESSAEVAPISGTAKQPTSSTKSGDKSTTDMPNAKSGSGFGGLIQGKKDKMRSGDGLEVNTQGKKDKIGTQLGKQKKGAKINLGKGFQKLM
jgi:hypothetical protein